MFKLFDRGKAALKPLATPYDILAVSIIEGLINDLENSDLKIKRLEITSQMLSDSNKELSIKKSLLEDHITALELIISNLRKQKVYSGQKFYDPNNHRLPTIYLCARWNEWYMIRQQNEAEPKIISSETFNNVYGEYVLMPKQNSNLKTIR